MLKDALEAVIPAFEEFSDGNASAWIWLALQQAWTLPRLYVWDAASLANSDEL